MAEFKNFLKDARAAILTRLEEYRDQSDEINQVFPKFCKEAIQMAPSLYITLVGDLPEKLHMGGETQNEYNHKLTFRVLYISEYYDEFQNEEKMLEIIGDVTDFILKQNNIGGILAIPHMNEMGYILKLSARGDNPVHAFTEFMYQSISYVDRS